MKIPKKIVFVGLTGYTNAPTRVRCYNFAKILNSQGWDTEVLGIQPDLAPDYLKGKEMSAMLHVPEQLKLELVEKSIPLIESMGPAIFYLQKTHYHAAAVYHVCRKNGWPLVLDYDDDDRTRSSLFESYETSMKYFGVSGDMEILKKISSHAACCIASSSNISKFLSIWNPRTYLIETGADTDKFNYTDRSSHESTNIVWLGQLWGKPILDCLDIACRAMQQVYHNNVPCHFHIYGRGMENELPAYLDFKYPNVPISFKGWVAPDDVPGVLDQMDIALYPQNPTQHDYEWMCSKSPTKLFEYMAAGLPVAATAMGDVCRIIRNGNNSFLSHSVSEMADQITFLAGNRNARLDMGKEASKTINEQYSLSALGDKLSGILEDIHNELYIRDVSLSCTAA